MKEFDDFMNMLRPDLLTQPTDEEIEAILKEGRENPLSTEESLRMWTGIIKNLQEKAKERGDTTTSRQLIGDPQQLAAEMIAKRDKTQADAIVFGEEVWVYCNQHLRPHLTGWCSVGIRNKTKLDATDEAAAYAECRAKGYTLYQDD